jgi:hypothetical protein
MAATTQITLPNGRQYEQPTGLFINNEFVEARGDEFTVSNPVYAKSLPPLDPVVMPADTFSGTEPKRM